MRILINSWMMKLLTLQPPLIISDEFLTRYIRLTSSLVLSLS